MLVPVATPSPTPETTPVLEPTPTPVPPPGDPGADKSGNLPGWMAAFSKEVKADEKMTKALSKYNHLDEAGKALVELETLKERAIVIPGEGADQKEKEAFEQTLRKVRGVPEKKEDYQLQRPEMPKGMNYDENLENVFRETAYELGINQKEFETIGKGFNEYFLKQAETFVKSRQDAEKVLREELTKKWGVQFDANATLAQRAFLALATPNIIKLYEYDGKVMSPDLTELFYEIGRNLSEDKLVEAEGKSAPVKEAGTSQTGRPKLDYSNPKNKRK